MKPKQPNTTPIQAILIILFTIIVFSCRSQEYILEPQRITERVINIKYNCKERSFKLSVVGIPVKQIKTKE